MIGRWWSRLTLRGRISLVSTAVVALGVVAGALVLVFAVRISLERTLDSSAERAGSNVAELVAAGKAPNPLVNSVAGVEQVQVVDYADMAVISASLGTDQARPLLSAGQITEALRTGAAVEVTAAEANNADDLRIIAVGVPTPDSTYAVLVATPASRIDDAERAVRDAALFGAPIGLIAVAVLTYFVVGRTLRPVAALREGARSIAAGGRLGPDGPRLPVPAARDEIFRLAVTLNNMLDRIAAANARQRAFVDDAAHEFRSPLASLRVQLEVAERLGPGTDWTEVTRDAMVDVNRLTALVDDMLALARLDAATAAGHGPGFEPVSMATLVTDTLDDYPSVQAHVETGGDDVVLGQPSSLRRVLVNLLDNAVRHADERVDVTVDDVEQADRTWVRVVVADDGPGIAPAERDRVFDRFYRVDTARARDDGGTGLGLAIVRDVLAAHDGVITLDDNHPGLRVTVLLPLATTDS